MNLKDYVNTSEYFVDAHLKNKDTDIAELELKLGKIDSTFFETVDLKELLDKYAKSINKIESIMDIHKIGNKMYKKLYRGTINTILHLNNKYYLFYTNIDNMGDRTIFYNGKKYGIHPVYKDFIYVTDKINIDIIKDDFITNI